MNRLATRLAVVCGLLTLALSFAPNAHAQEGFRIGLRGVPMLTFLQNKQDADNANLTKNLTFGYSAGIMIGQNFTPHSGFELHALYGIMGQSYTVQVTPDSSVDLQTTLQYIKIPVMYRYVINPNSKLQFYAAAGGQMGIRMGGFQSVNGTKIEEPENATRRFQEYYYETDFCAVAQAGLEYKFTDNWSLNAYLHFEHSVIDMEDKVLKAQGRTATLNMGVGFGVGVSYLFWKGAPKADPDAPIMPTLE